MRYLSVCAGIEAASVAWHPLGWRAAALSEIEAFPRAVLKHHYPHVPLHGDFTTIEGGEYGPIDLLVGGTPWTGRGTPLVPIAFSAKDHGADAGDISPTLRAGGFDKSHANGGVMPAVALPLSAVRRITPEEAEALQGFPRGYTLIPYRGKPAADGPRYKSLGNSMAVPCMRWLGERIAMVERLTTETRAA